MLSRKMVPTTALAPHATVQTTASTMAVPHSSTAPVTTVVQPGVTEEMVYGAQDMLLQRVAAVEEILTGKVGQMEAKVMGLLDASGRHDQALQELSAGVGRQEASLQQKFGLSSQATAAVAANLDERVAQLMRAGGHQQDRIQNLEASVAQLQQALSLCAKEAETRVRFDGANNDLRQLRADTEQDLTNARESFARAEVALRGLVAEADAKHCRNEEDLRAALHRVELEATQARTELMNRDDSITKELEHAEVSLRGLLSEATTAHSRAEEELRAGLHRAELQAAQSREEFVSRDTTISKALERTELALRGQIAEVAATRARAEEELRAGLQRTDLAAAQARDELAAGDEANSKSLESAEVALRALVAETSSAHGRAEEELRAALHRTEMQAAQARDELVARDEAISKALDRAQASLQGAVSEVDAKHARAGDDIRDALHRAGVEAAQTRSELISRDDALGAALERADLALRSLVTEVSTTHTRAEEELRAALQRTDAQAAQTRDELLNRDEAISSSLDRVELALRGLVAEVNATHARAGDEIRAAIHRSEVQAAQSREELIGRDEAISRTLERTDAALRGLLADTSAAHSRVEEELKAAQYRVELQSAQAREELITRDDALAADLRALGTKLDAQLERLDGQRRAEIEEVRRQQLELEARLAALGDLERSTQATTARLSAAEAELRQLKADVQHDFAAVQDAVARHDAAFRGLLAEADAKHGRAEDELRAALHQAELQAAQTREELMGRDDAIDSSLESAQTALRKLISDSAALAEELKAAQHRAEQQAAHTRELMAKDEALSAALAGTEAALRSLVADTSAGHSRAEEEIRGAHHRAELQAAQTRAELMARDEALSSNLERAESALSGHISEAMAAHGRAEEEIRAATHRLEAQALQTRDELVARDTALSVSLERAEGALRGLVAETAAAHTRAEEGLNASLHRAELEAARARKELASRNDALAADVRELAAKLLTHVDRIDAQRHADLHEAKRQLMDLEKRVGGLVDALERGIQATNVKLAAVDTDQTCARLRAVSELSAKADVLEHEVAKGQGEVAQVRGAMVDTTATVRGAMMDTTAAARRQGERLEDLEGTVAVERECRGFESRLAAETATLALSPTSKLRSRLDTWRYESPRSPLPPLRTSSLERPSYLTATETLLL